MIQVREIMALAEELSLRPDVVEKDYVLGWLLHGIGSHPELAPCAAGEMRLQGHSSTQHGRAAAYKDELVAEWDNMLAHQLPVLPPVDLFWDTLAEFFAWLARGFVSPAPVAYRLAEGETLIRPQLGRIGRIMGGRPGHMEMVRFAAANRLCVDLVYRKENGEVVHPRIEPYSLRRTRAGEIVLHVVRADDQQHRSYRIDRIQDVQVSHQTFTPRYAVELSPEATLSIPPTASRVQTYAPARISIPRPFGGVTYVYRCPVCGKQFERKRQDNKLHPHKAPAGWQCSGRSGLLVNRKY